MLLKKSLQKTNQHKLYCCPDQHTEFYRLFQYKSAFLQMTAVEFLPTLQLWQMHAAMEGKYIYLYPWQFICLCYYTSRKCPKCQNATFPRAVQIFTENSSLINRSTIILKERKSECRVQHCLNDLRLERAAWGHTSLQRYSLHHVGKSLQFILRCLFQTGSWIYVV